MTKWFRRDTGAVACPPMLGSGDRAWQCDTLEQRLDVQPPAWPPQYFPPTAPVQSVTESMGPWPLVSDVSLPGGAMGGVPYGGGLPCDDGPLFGPNTALVEMPWRAAGGEAHPMSAVVIGFFDEDTSELPQVVDRALAPAEPCAAGTEWLPIFESLLEEMRIERPVSGEPPQPAAGAGDDWSKAHTVRLPIIEQRRTSRQEPPPVVSQPKLALEPKLALDA